MDKPASLLIIVAAVLSFLASTPLLHGAAITSCDQTPHPQVCHHYITSTPHPSATLHSEIQTHRAGFRSLALQATTNQAREAHRLVSSSGFSRPSINNNERAKLALADCIELYEETASLLNQTAKTNDIDDIQTYLSAAIAHQETCKNGFTDLNLSSHHLRSFPHLRNFSMLLSNALAINQAASKPTPLDAAIAVHGRRLLQEDCGDRDRFPRWLSASDRKLLQQAPPKVADIVVAKDGSGNYMTITDAINDLHRLRQGSPSKRFAIYVKAGVYVENVEIMSNVKNLMMFGDGIDKTVVTGSKNAGSKLYTTFRTPTFAVKGDGFMARDMTFENTAGPENYQAVALLSSSDYSVFYRCSFRGYQDTLYAHCQRQFYRDCDIYGTVDFIFGDAAAVFQNCNIYVRRPMEKQKNTITAQGRENPHENSGIVIHRSTITAASDLKPFRFGVETYLGRPWKQYSRTIIMKSILDDLIHPLGWEPWNDTDFALDTLYYGEYMNVGGGANTAGRVKWKGYHVITDPLEAGKFTPTNFIAGRLWIPAYRVPFTDDL